MSDLRPPVDSDGSALASLGRQTFIETFGSLYTENNLNTFLSEVYADEVILDELRDPKLEHQVIEQDGELVAFIKIGPVHVPIGDPPSGAMEIWQIYVLKSHLGQGLGDRLMTWAFSQFKQMGATDLYVSVFSENERAIRFYQKYGFEKVGEYGFPVGDHLDLEWIMCRKEGEKAHPAKKIEFGGNK